jgi:hypothetical protein
MTSATRSRLVSLLWSGQVSAGTVVPDLILNGYRGRHFDWPTWALDVLLATEEAEEDLRSTEVVYRSCGRCLEPTGMAALVYGHACKGEPLHFPRWARGVLGAVL